MLRSCVISLMLGVLTLTCGCTQRSLVLTNETNSSLNIECSIDRIPYEWFSRDQYFRFGVNPGERWDSLRASPDDRVQWKTYGVKVRAFGADIQEAQKYYIRGLHSRVHLTIRGTWPDVELHATLSTGEEVDVVRPGDLHDTIYP